MSARRLSLVGLICALALLGATSVASAARYVDLVNGTSGVTGYWRLAELSGTTAAAQKGPAGTYGNSPALGLPGLLRSESTNMAAGFAGSTGRHVAIPDGTAVDFSTAYTLEAWVRFDTAAPGSTNYVFCKNGAYALRLNGAGDWEGVAVRSDNLWQYVDSGPEDRPVAGTIYHVVTTFDGAYQRLYVNGQIADREPATGTLINTSATLKLAGCPDYDTWDGTIDEPAIYNVALSPTQIRDHYETGADNTPPAAPTGVKATAGDKEVAIDWQGSAADDIASYTVHRAASPGSSTSAAASPALTSSEWTSTGLTNGTLYEYWVVATDSRGNVSSPSARVTARPMASVRYREAVTASSGIQGYWRLGETSGTTAAATVGDNGTIAGAPALNTAGLLLKDTNTAIDFDGADDQVTIADSDRVDLSSVVSFEAWVRPDARTTGNANIVAKPGAYVLALRNDGVPEARVYAGGTTNVALGTAPLALGQPYHLVGTYDRSKIRLYVNGAFVSEVALSGNLTQNANALQLGSHANSARFNGVIDEAAIYDTTLSGAEVKDRFDAGRPNSAPAAPAGLTASAGDGMVSLVWSPNAETNLVGYDVYRKGSGGAWTRLNKSRVTAARYSDFTAANDVTHSYMVKAVNKLGLVSAASATVSAKPRLASSYRESVATAGAGNLRGYWRLGETRGGIAVPEAGPDGDYVNNPALGQPGLLRGDPDRAVKFSADKHVQVPYASALDVTTAFTLEALVRNDSAPSVQRHALCRTGTIGLRLTTANDLEAVFYRSDGVMFVQAASDKPVVGTTYHVAMTYDGAALRIYLNGVLKGSQAITGLVKTTTNPFWIGGCGGTQTWDGVVDEPALYGTALSATQIKEHHDVGADGTAPAAPTGLNAVPADRQVALNWSANGESDLSGYEVLRGDAAGGPYTKVSGRLTAAAFTDAELENGKPGYYRVRAVDKAGNVSANSAEVKATPTSAPVLLEPQTLHADGAELSWNRFDPATDGAFERYEVHRSTSAGFTPSSSTLLATIPDRMITTYRDTSAGAGKTYTYKLTVNGRVSGEWTVTLPPNGESRKVLQPDATIGRATYIREGTCANRGADPMLRVGTTAGSKVRGLVGFDVSDIRSDATITAARISLYAAEPPGVGVTIGAHRATTAWEEGDGRGTCDVDGASWSNSQAGDPWNTAGADFSATAEGSVTRAAGSAAGWDDYVITPLVQRWIKGEVPNFGVVLKASDETYAGGKLVGYHADGTTTPASLRPRLIVDYADSSRTNPPAVAVTAPVGGDTVKGSSVRVLADAGDDRRVAKVDFFAGATALGSDTSAPYEATWNSTAAANGATTLKAVATDDVGNTSEATRNVTVANSAAPTTAVEPPSASYATTVKADNPIGYYRLGEAAGATVMNDSSGNARHGTYSGAATTLGQSGLTRDGDTAAKVTQTVSGGPRTSALSAPGVSSSSQMSVEVWMDFQGIAVDGFDHVIERGYSHSGYWGTNQGRWVVFTNKWSNGTEVVCFEMSKPGPAHVGACAPIPRGRLQVVGTYDGSTLRIYVDGTLGGSTPLSGVTLDTTTDIHIAENGTQDQKIDDVSIYNTALGPADVQQHYDAAGVDSYTSAVQADGPSGWWRFGETSGTTIADSSGAGRSGTLSGDVTLGHGSLLGRASGDSAALFGAPGGNENDGVATINGLSGLLGTNVTAEAWIDYAGPTGADEWMHVMSRGWGSPGGWKIAVYSCWDGCGHQGSGFFVNQGGTVLRAVTELQPGRLHVVATYDGAKLRYYLNGALVATENVTALAMTTSAPLLIGSGIDTGNQITIDEAAVYNKVLSDERVRQHYVAGRARAIDGTETVKATAADDGSVAEVQFFVDGKHFETDNAAPYQASLATLAAGEPTYDGTHVVTTKAVDNHGNVNTASENVVVANASPAARAHIAAASVEPSVPWNPAAGAQQQTQSVDVTITNLGDRTMAAATTDVRYRWVRPNGQTATTGDTALSATAAPNETVTTAVTVPPPPLPDGVERAKHKLEFDLVDKSPGTPVVLSTRGNPVDENPSDVFRTDVSLGLERWHNYHGEELGGGLQHLVNVASGNSLVRWTPFESPGRGLATVVDLTYNGLEDKSSSAAGNNWSLSVSSLTRFGTPLNLHPNKGNTALPHDYIELVDGDGTTHRFEGKLAADNTPFYEEPAGVHLYLREYSATDKLRKWAITRPDRTTFFFDREGWPTFVEDNNGNRITFTVVRVAPSEDPGGPKYRITRVTDAAGRPFDLTYWSKAEARSPHVRGKVKRITDHTGSALDFEYYDDGNVRKFIQRGSTGGGMPVPDREWIFTYTDSNGDAAALDATQRANPPQHVGNQSTRIYSVRDPRGHETEFKYYGTSHPDMRWRVTERENRANEKTAFTYDAANRRTTVTAPLSRVTKFDYDANGQVTQITDPANRATTLVWGADRHVSSVTEPKNADEQTPRVQTYKYDDNGYLTEHVDKRADADLTVAGHQDRVTTIAYERDPAVIRVDAKDVAGKWKAGRTVSHISQLDKVTKPRGNFTTFDYDQNTACPNRGNLTTVTDGENGQTRFAYNCADGTVTQSTDPRNNVTTYSYDANGLPTAIAEPESRTTRMAYDNDGLLLWAQDPNHPDSKYPAAPAACDGPEDARDYRTCFEYDAFHRLRRQSAPKSTEHERDDLLWSNVEYDANDNVKQTFAPALGQHPVTGNRTSKNEYDAMDRTLEMLGPDDETKDAAGNVIPDLTTFRYDAAGRPDLITLPKGNATPDDPNNHAIFLAYDELDRVRTRTRFADGKTIRTGHCYDAAGDLRSVTKPEGGIGTTFTCTPYATASHTTKMDYYRDHRLQKKTDPENKAQTREYDPNGNVSKTTDAQNTPTTYAYDARDAVTKVVKKFDGTRELVTRTEYDAAGNVLHKATPRATSKNPNLTSYAGKEYVTTYTYDGLNRVTKVQLPDDVGNTTEQAYVHRRYDGNGKETLTTHPTTASELQNVEADDKITFGYFDPGWLRSKDEAPLPTVRYDYRAEGWQTRRTATASNGEQAISASRYFKDGQLAERDGRDGNTNTYAYDIHNKMTSAQAAIGTHKATEQPMTVKASYDGLDREIDVRERSDENRPWNVSTTGYNRNSEIVENLDDATATTLGATPTGGRRHTYEYFQNGWLKFHQDFGANTGVADDRKVENQYTDTGWRRLRIMSRTNATGSYTPRVTTETTYSLNGQPTRTKTYKDGDPTAIREQHDVEYFDGNGQYFNGHRFTDSFVRSAPNAGVKCQPGSTACVRKYEYDAQDRPWKETRTVPGATPSVTTREYKLEPAGNLKQVTINGAPQGVNHYEGTQLKETRTADNSVRTAWFRYDAFGNNDCVTTGTESNAVCDSDTGSSASGELVVRRRYDDLGRMELSREFSATVLQRSSRTSYDGLDRPKVRDESVRVDGARRDKTTTFRYRGLSKKVVHDERRWINPGGTDARWKNTTREYSYDANGARSGMTSQREGGTQKELSYGYDVNGSVSQLLDDQGNAKAAYSYTAYGEKEDDLTSQQDVDDPTLTSFPEDPANPYGYSDKRNDFGAGTLDMGARHFSPQTGGFLQADMYEDAVGDLGLSEDPLTQNRYAMAGGNPLSFVETDGHEPVEGSYKNAPYQASEEGGAYYGNSSLSRGGHVARGAHQRRQRQCYASGATPDSCDRNTETSDQSVARGAAQHRVVREGFEREAQRQKEESEGGLLGAVHTTLDVAGLIPGVGEIADLANAGLYLAEGNEMMAALSAAAAIPFAGWAATGAKAGLRMSDELGGAAMTGGRSFCSFSGETRVRMADGSTKPIGEIRVGDRVLATDPATGKRSARRVTHVWVHRDRVIRLHVDGETLTTTEDHPFWNASDRQWQEVRDLDAGDRVATADGRLIRVHGASSTGSYTTAAYDLTVEGIHSYHVGAAGVLVHNCGELGDVGLASRGFRPAPGTRVRPSGIPSNWRIRGTRTAGGTRYTDPSNSGNEVRVMQGSAKSPYPNSQRPYVRWQRNGQPLDGEGNVLPTAKVPEAHIPLEQFEFRPDLFE